MHLRRISAFYVWCTMPSNKCIFHFEYFTEDFNTLHTSDTECAHVVYTHIYKLCIMFCSVLCVSGTCLYVKGDAAASASDIFVAPNSLSLSLSLIAFLTLDATRTRQNHANTHFVMRSETDGSSNREPVKTPAPLRRR